MHAWRDESGQATIEFAGVLPVAILALLGVWQIVLVATTFVFAGHAARVGARALAVGSPVASAAEKDLPSGWQHGAKVSKSAEQQGSQSVDVSLPVPVLIPGLLDVGAIHSSARTVIEDQLLGGEQQSWSLLGQSTVQGNAVTGTALLAGLQTVKGDKAVIDQKTGDAEAPADAPPAVKELIAAANEIHTTSYVWGGGHSGSLAQLRSGYDCSGATSFVLFAAGLLGPTAEVSGDLEHYGQPGTGKWVTVYGSAPHAFIDIAGLAFDTADWGGPNIPAGSGPRWRYSPTANLADGNTWYPTHPQGL